MITDYFIMFMVGAIAAGFGCFAYGFVLRWRQLARQDRKRRQAIEIAHQHCPGAGFVMWAGECDDRAEAGAVWVSPRALSDQQMSEAYELINIGLATDENMAEYGLHRIDNQEGS